MKQIGTEHGRDWSRRFERAEIVAMVVVVASAGLFHVTERVNQFFVANADNLLVAELFEDLGSGGSLADWYLPYSPYIVPDWIIYGVAALVSSTEEIRLALFAVIQFAVAVLATASISRSVTGRVQWSATSAVAAVAVLAAALQIKPFIFIAAPLVHFGTFALMLWLLALTLRYLAGDDRWLLWLGLSLAIGVGLVVSDRIIVVWFHAPGALAMAGWAWWERRRLRLAAIWIASHVVVLGVTLPLAGLIRTRQSAYDLSLSLSSPRSAAMRLWRTFVDNGHESGWWFWAAVASLPVAWLVVVAGRSVLGRAPLDPDARRFLAVFLPATAASTIGAQILLSGAVVPGPRYNLPILFLPLLLLASLVPPRWPSPVHRGVLAVPVAIALVWSASALDEIDPTGPDHIACVRRQLELSGSVTGVASYWDARDLVVYLDDPDVTVGTYDLFGRPEQINVSADSYRDRYDFVLRSERVPLWELDLGMIEAINGEPDTAIECGIYTLWDYGPSGMTMDPFPQPGSSVVFDGCDLDTEVGALDAGSCTLSSTGEAGYLDFGPYVAVPPGTYRVEIAYQAAGGEPLGTWDVATFHQHGETPTVVEEGELAGTGGGVGHVELEWTAANDPTGELTVAEIRTRVDAGASGQLLSIELTRIS